MFYSTFSFDKQNGKNLIFLIKQTYITIPLLRKLSNYELYQCFLLKSKNVRKSNNVIYIELLDSFFVEHLLLSEFFTDFPYELRNKNTEKRNSHTIMNLYFCISDNKSIHF